MDDVGLCSQVALLLGPGTGQSVVRDRRPSRLPGLQALLGARGDSPRKEDALAFPHPGVVVVAPVMYPLVKFPPKCAGGLAEGREVHLLHPLVGHAQPLVVRACSVSPWPPNLNISGGPSPHGVGWPHQWSAPVGRRPHPVGHARTTCESMSGHRSGAVGGCVLIVPSWLSKHAPWSV